MNVYYFIFSSIFLLSVQIDFASGSVNYKIEPEGKYKVVIYFRGGDEHGEKKSTMFTDEKGKFIAFQDPGPYTAAKVYKIVIEKFDEKPHQDAQSELKHGKGQKVGHGQHGHEKKKPQKHVLNFNDNANGPDYLYPPEGKIVTINLAHFPATKF